MQYNMNDNLIESKPVTLFFFSTLLHGVKEFILV